jgi:hypothetical protein
MQPFLFMFTVPNKTNMNKILPCLFLWTCLGLHAQEYTETFYKLRLGLVAGPKYASLRGGYDSYKPELGYFGGITMEIRFNETVSLCLGVGYDKRSFKNESTFLDPFLGGVRTSSTKMVFEYIHIPIGTRFYVDTDKMLFVGVGAYYNQLTDARTIGENSLVLKDFLKGDYGLTLGVGYNFELSPRSNLALALQDDFGLGNIKKGEYSQLNTNAVKLSANWSLNLCKQTKKFTF